LWEAGRSFGTVGVSVDGEQIEVTTWRTERYDGQTRKPIVGRAFSLKEDLERRDFTINAMAMVAEDGGLRLVDYFCGRQHLEEQVLATPGDPQGTFWDDPLRIVRLWRFQILLGFQVEPETLTAARRLAHRLKIVSQERITAELARVAEVATIDWPWAVESAYMLGIEDRLF